MRGRTTIVIAHRPATIALADRVVLLEEGRVVAEGTHDALLGESERYRVVLAAGESERLGRGADGGGAEPMWGSGAVSEEDKLDREQARRLVTRRRAHAAAVPRGR